jgi:hypothetical protein
MVMFSKGGHCKTEIGERKEEENAKPKSGVENSSAKAGGVLCWRAASEGGLCKSNTKKKRKQDKGRDGGVKPPVHIREE